MKNSADRGGCYPQSIQWWITPSEMCRILHILRKPNSIIALLFIQNIFPFLRTVPTKYKGFCARLGPRGKSRSLQRLLESAKKNMDSHAFFRDN